MNIQSNWVYDIETMINYFSAVFINVETKEIRSFELLDADEEKNELKELLDFLNTLALSESTIIGFNNIAFDMQVLQKFNGKLLELSTKDCITQIYNWAQEAIEAEFPVVKPYNFKIKNMDLYTLNHFDSKAKRGVSLKWLSYVMDSKWVMEMPYKHYERITAKQAEEILTYNINDVNVTMQFYDQCQEAITVRKELSELYNMDLTNYSEPKIVKQTLLKDLAKDLKIPTDELKTMRSKGSFPMHLGSLIFDYVKFESPEFKALKKYLENRWLEETKGVFTDIVITEDMTELLKYVPQEFIKFKNKGTVKVLEKLAIKFGDTVYVFGSGGIHSHTKDLVVDNTNHQLVDLDVTSYYPMTAIKNRLYPRHLGVQFCDRYLWYFEKRKTYKKGTTLNYFYKLLLNTIYGLSNEENGFLYDPRYTMSITINGQLMLAMLIEMVELSGAGKCLTANTDGATFATNDDESLMKLVKKWEDITMLSMERADYKKLIMRDVNNYIWIDTDNKAKVKGYFEYPKPNKDFHKSRDMKIVVDSLVKYFVNGEDVYENIMKSNDILLFKKGAKTVGKNIFVEEYFDSNFNKKEVPIGKICRYYVSLKGVDLVKKLPALNRPYKDPSQFTLFDTSEITLVDRKSSVESGYTCSIFNNLDNIPSNKINKAYYLEEANKILKRLDPKYAKELNKKIKVLSDYYANPNKIVLDDFTKNHI